MIKNIPMACTGVKAVALLDLLRPEIAIFFSTVLDENTDGSATMTRTRRKKANRRKNRCRPEAEAKTEAEAEAVAEAEAEAEADADAEAEAIQRRLTPVVKRMRKNFCVF